MQLGDALEQEFFELTEAAGVGKQEDSHDEDDADLAFLLEHTANPPRSIWKVSRN
jgi:hypothetical protein